MSHLASSPAHLAFQPIIDLHSGRVEYLETYLRLASHDHRARLLAAENDGSIAELDLRVLDLALPLLNGDRRLALNVSPHTILSQPQRFLGPLLALPEKLRPIIEINDPYLLESSEQIRLAGLLDGITIGLNHYQGTALETEVLTTIKPRWVKLDSAPIESTFADQGCNLLQQALNITRKLGVDLVITRIEDAERLAHIRHLCGARWGQGNHLARESDSLDFPVALPLPSLDGNLRAPGAHTEACWHCLYSRLSGQDACLQAAG